MGEPTLPSFVSYLDQMKTVLDLLFTMKVEFLQQMNPNERHIAYKGG